MLCCDDTNLFNKFDVIFVLKQSNIILHPPNSIKRHLLAEKKSNQQVTTSAELNNVINILLFPLAETLNKKHITAYLFNYITEL